MPFIPKNFTSTMDYLKALEEERKKILVFERELPLSLQLVTHAIETCKQQQQQQQMMMMMTIGSEEICSEGPVLEEFIPLRPSYSSSDEENNQKPTMLNGGGTVNVADDQKPDWLRSVQLWNQLPEPKGDVLRTPIAVNAKKVGGAFHPFEKEKIVMAAPAPVVVAAAPASSTTENTINGGSGSGGCAEEKEKEKEGHSQRKARRCWSPELHRRFLHALQQLGGSHAATPKQIRELMKVDGLTNDEVKSHLQKYRLHTRRPTAAAVQSGSSINSQQPQIVLVGGIWMPPPEYTAAAAVAGDSAGQSAADDSTGAPSNGIYAPVALLPSKLGPQQKQKRQLTTNRSPTGPLNSERRCDGDDDNSTADGEQTNSGSSATSSSSQTTTASPSLLSSSQ